MNSDSIKIQILQKWTSLGLEKENVPVRAKLDSLYQQPFLSVHHEKSFEAIELLLAYIPSSCGAIPDEDLKNITTKEVKILLPHFFNSRK